MENTAKISRRKVMVPVSLFNLLRTSPFASCSAIACALLSSALTIAPFWFIYLIAVELFSPIPEMAAVWRYIALAGGLVILRWLLMAFAHILAHICAFHILHYLRLAMARQLGNVPLSFFSNRGSGSTRKTLSDDVNSLESFYAHILPDVVSAVIVPLIAIVFLIIADWRLALVMIIPLPLAIFAQWWMMRGMGERMQEWGEYQMTIADQAGEYVRGIDVVKSFGLEARSFGKLANAVNNAVSWIDRFTKETTRSFVVFATLLKGNIVLVAPIGAAFYATGSLDLATYVLFLLVSPIVLEPLLRLVFAQHEQLHLSEAIKRINSILEAEIIDDHAVATPHIENYDIVFSKVNHSYGDKQALSCLSFTAKAGQLTAIVGHSGSGKSTLVRLVARLYDLQDGSIKIGGTDIRDWPLDSLLAHISIVFQDVVLFYGSVYDNLRIAKPNASCAEIEIAARAARAHDFISALPKGYDTQLGERGATLSGGERQRLSIARALLKNAPILLLDEATASLDAENETLIQQALSELCKNRTVLMIGHRLHTVMSAQHIITMDHGKIVGQGNHSKLLETCSVYRDLWHSHGEARDWTL